MTDIDAKKELERAYRCIRGLYGKIANGEMPDQTMLAYHSPTLGAAIRFVDEQQLDGAEYFIGKRVDVLHDALRGYEKRPSPSGSEQ